MAPGFYEPDHSICLSTPLSSTVVCETVMFLSDVQGTEKKVGFVFFFICCIPDDLDVMDYGIW